MQNFTFDEFASFPEGDAEWLNELSNAMEKTITLPAFLEPSKQVVRRLEDYNKSLSIRKSAKMGAMKLLLN